MLRLYDGKNYLSRISYLNNHISVSPLSKTLASKNPAPANMLLSEGLLANIITHLNILKIFGPFPFSFDKIKGVLGLSSSRNILATQLSNVLLLLISILVWIQLGLFRKSVPTVVTFEGMIYGASNIIFVIGNFIYLQRKDHVVELFNLFLKFEKSQIESKKGNFDVFLNSNSNFHISAY